MSTTCEICGKKDLFSAVTGEGVCAVCVMRYFRGGHPTKEQIATVKAHVQGEIETGIQ